MAKGQLKVIERYLLDFRRVITKFNSEHGTGNTQTRLNKILEDDSDEEDIK